MKKLIYTAVLGLSLMCGSCTDFLEDQLPQGTISDEQLKNPAYIDNLVISAYAYGYCRRYQFFLLHVEL